VVCRNKVFLGPLETRMNFLSCISHIVTQRQCDARVALAFHYRKNENSRSSWVIWHHNVGIYERLGLTNISVFMERKLVYSSSLEDRMLWIACIEGYFKNKLWFRVSCSPTFIWVLGVSA
jgi:hypothetical protein